MLESRILKLYFLNLSLELTPLERNVMTFILSPKSRKSWIEEFFCLSENCNFSFLVSSYLWLVLADQNALAYYRTFFLCSWTLFLDRSIAIVNYIINCYYCNRLTKSSSYEGSLIKTFD